MDLKQLNMATLQRYTSPQAIKDFDSFLDNLPTNVGLNALMAAGFVCLLGGGSVWFAAQQTEKVSKLHTELMTIQALKPPVPTLKYVAVPQKTLKPLVDKITGTFKGVTITGNADGDLTFVSQDTDYFPQFLAAVSYLQRGGKNWKVRINTLCVGRDCKAGTKLSANFKIESVLIGEPEKKEPEKAPDATAKPDDKPAAKE